MSIGANKWWEDEALRRVKVVFSKLYVDVDRFEALVQTEATTHSNLLDFRTDILNVQPAIQGILARSVSAADITRFARQVRNDPSFDLASEYTTLLSRIEAVRAALVAEFSGESIPVDGTTLEQTNPVYPSTRFTAAILPAVTALKNQAGGL